MKALLLCFFASLLLLGCAGSDIFPALGNNIASPNGMAINAAATRLYLVNANSNVLYNWREGSVHVLDITDPLHPSLIGVAPTQSFSGEAVLDEARKLLYITNRFSEQTTVTEDHLLVINADESSADFLAVTSQLTGKDPYGLACCYPADRLWIATEANDFEYKNLSDMSGGSINLLTTTSEGGQFTQSETSYIVLIGNQAFLPRNRGGLLVINLDKAGDPAANAVDYWVEDINQPGGIATDGTYLYIVDLEQIGDDWNPALIVLDPTKMPPLTGNTTTEILDKNDDGILVAQIEVSNQPQTVFVTSKYAFVTCRENDIVNVIDIATWTKVADIAVGSEPFNMVLYAPGGVETYLYVGNVESNTLSIIDVNTLAVVGTYP